MGVSLLAAHCAGSGNGNSDIGTLGSGSSGSGQTSGAGGSGSGAGNSSGSSGSSGGAQGGGSGVSQGGSNGSLGGAQSGGSNGGSSDDASGDDASGDDSSTGSAGDDGGTTSSGSAGADGGSWNCFATGSGTDFSTDGPLTPTSADNTTVSCTIFQPTVLGTGGCLNPVIVWGNGTFNTPSNYTALFNHFASQGFIVAAADTSNAGSGQEMLACLSYIISQNTTSGSALEGHIDVNHIASSGYSQGGAGCLAAGEDPRFTTVLAVSPYVVIALGNYDPSTYAAAQIHPLFMISGSDDTVAPANNNQEPIFMTAPVPIFWGTHAGSTHFEVLNNGGAYEGPMTAWFRWKLMGDPNARQWFENPPCDLCNASGWTVQTNSLWM
jgi:hypothetical protein